MDGNSSTMTSSNFLIGPTDEGLRKDLKPFAIPEKAFTTLNNALQFRGRIIRRPGYLGLARLSPDGTTFPANPVMGLCTRELFGIDLQQLIAFDTTASYLFNTSTSQFNTLPSVMPVTWSGTNFQFFFTTNYAGAFWATNSKPGLNGRNISAIATGATTTITTSVPHGFTTGQTVTFINVGGTTELNGQTAVITVTGPSTFTVAITTSNAFTSNGIALNSQVAITGQDGIRYYAQTSLGNTWVNYNPPIDTNNALAGALLIFPYRGYLVFLNTTEGNDQGTQNFGNRARCTQLGIPYYSQPVPVTPDVQSVDPKAARDDLFGRGDAFDAPTQEVIVGAAFIRDILVVYFERSTWRLRFVNNTQNPFVWERVNVELGADCTFSTITFDKGLMAIGNRGIVISDGNDTVRFDEKIPDDIFNIRQANNGLQRVCGIRTFRKRLNFWTYPDNANPNGTFPDKLLVFNYDTKNWSYFDDCFTTFGYYYPSSLGPTWAELGDPWSSYTYISADSSISQEGQETILAGNQQGFVFMLDQTDGENDPSLYISAISAGTFSSPNNNLPDGTWINITGVTGTSGTDGVSLNGRNFKISNPTNDPNNFTINEFSPIDGGLASGSSYAITIDFVPIIPGSVQINVGSIQFVDTNFDGNLFGSDNTSTGTINYTTGDISLTFSPALGSPTEVYIRVVSFSPEQILEPVNTTGSYTGSGLIAKISNFDIQTKIFNFFGDDKRSRLSKIDFYTDATANGQFTVNVFPDSSNVIANSPLPDNLQSNIVLTSPNPYQIGDGNEAINRLYCDVWAQTVQLQITMSDQQQAVSAVNSEDLELLAMIFTLKRGGRLV